MESTGRRPNQRGGFVLLTVLIVLLALLVLTVPYLTTARNADRASSQLAHRTQARLSLDAAARHARAQLSQSHASVDPTPDSDSLDELVAIRKHTAADFHLYAGDDGMTLTFMSLGASGIVSVASHFVGNEIQAMIAQFLAGNVAAANEVHMKYERLFIDLFCMTNPIPTKTALRLQGWAVGGPRLPLVDAPPEVEAKMRELLKSVDLL